MKASRWITLGAAAIGAGVVALQVWTPAATKPAAAALPVEVVRAEPATDYARLLRRDSLVDPVSRAPFASTATPPRAASPKPVAAPVAEAPAPATVPKFPYRYAGKIHVGRSLHQAYFMRTNGELVSALPGQVIDGMWRIDSLTNEKVEVTYLPLAASFPLALAELIVETAPSAQAAAQVAPGAEERGLFERRPRSSEPTIAAGGPARATAPAIIGAPATAPAAAGRTSAAPLTASSAPAPAAAARLGTDVPTSGSMPTASNNGLTVADAAARGIAGGATPQGKLGQAAPSGKLGVD